MHSHYHSLQAPRIGFHWSVCVQYINLESKYILKYINWKFSWKVCHINNFWDGKAWETSCICNFNIAHVGFMARFPELLIQETLYILFTVNMRYNEITVLVSHSCCLLHSICDQILIYPTYPSWNRKIFQPQFVSNTQTVPSTLGMYVKVLVHTNIFHLKSEHVSLNILILDI